MADAPMTSGPQSIGSSPALQMNYRTADLGPGEWVRVTAFDSSAQWFEARYTLNRYNIECLMDAVSHPGLMVLLVRENAFPMASEILGLAPPIAPRPVIPLDGVPLGTSRLAGVVVSVDMEKFAQLCRDPDVKRIAVVRAGEGFRYAAALEGLLFTADSALEFTFTSSQEIIQATAIQLIEENALHLNAAQAPVPALPLHDAYWLPPPQSNDAGRTLVLVFLWIALVVLILVLVVAMLS